MTCGWAASILSHNQKIFLSCVLAKQKRTPVPLQTTINATYTVPVATLSKGNERMAKIKIRCGLSQQCTWISTEGKKSPSCMERATKGSYSTNQPTWVPALPHSPRGRGSGQSLGVLTGTLKKQRESCTPQTYETFRERRHLSSCHHFCYLWRLAIQNLKKPLNYFAVHFSSIVMKMIKLCLPLQGVWATAIKMSYKEKVTAGNSALTCWSLAIFS